MRRRGSNQQPLKDVITDWLSNHPMARKAKETQIIHLWGDMLGPVISKHTTSISFHSGKLQVRLDSAALRNELAYARTQIITDLNKELGEEMVKELILN